MGEFEQFQELLDENEVFYKTDEFENGHRLFRIPQKLKSGGFVDLLIIFGEDNIKIVGMKIATIEEPDKQAQCYELFNDLNCSYKYFKLYLDSDGDAMLNGDLTIDVCSGEFHPDVLMAYIGAALRVIEEAYPKLMKILWT